MFRLFPNKENARRANDAAAYVSLVYVEPISRPQICYSLNLNPSAKRPARSRDSYDAEEALRILRGCDAAADPQTVLNDLEEKTDCSFVDKLLEHINRNGLQPALVYKAAQVDKRLFSKIIADREYKPSKDTAIALLLALHLDIDEACEMLARAGYTLSHSSKRDIIIEFCFRERIFNLMDVNDILYRLRQKLIGRG